MSFAEQLFFECPPSARCLGCVRKLERQKQNKTVIERNTIRKFEWNEFCAMGKKKKRVRKVRNAGGELVCPGWAVFTV